ncbi:MAG: ATP-binding protein [candidate division WOR-3 bacterium]
MAERAKIIPKSCLWLFFITFTSVFLLFATENYPWQLRSIYEIETTYLIPSDFDGDDVDEIIESNKCYAFVKDQNGFLSKQFSAVEGNMVTALGFFRLNDTLSTDLLVSIKNQDTVSLRAVFSKKTGRLFVGKDISKPSIPGYDGIIREAIFEDINGDGYNEIICKVNTGFDLYPRGILVYDYKNNKELWHYWVGCNPPWCGNISCVDIDNDNRKEIFFGTLKTSNGALENGVDDFHPWVIALNPDGKLLWKKQFNEEVLEVRIHVGNIHSDQEPKLIACENSGTSESDYVNQIMILNPKDGTVEKYLQTGKQFLGMVVCDYDRDGKTEIITGNSDGVLRIFDCNLELLHEKNFNTAITVSHVVDLDGDGRTELLLTCQDGGLIILDEKLRILSNFKTPHGRIFYCLLARNKRQYNIIASVQSFENFIFTIYRINKVVIPKRIPVSSLIIIVTTLLFVGLIFSIYKYHFYVKRVHKMLDESPAGVMILDHANKIRYTNYLMRSMLGGEREALTEFINTKRMTELIRNPEEHKTFKFCYGDKVLSIYFTKVGGEKLLIVQDRTAEEAAKEVISWAGLAQRLAHEIKNPLSTINLTLQRMYQICHEKFGKKAEIIDNYAKSVLEEVERLRKVTDRFMRVLSIEKPEFTIVDINSLINETINKHEETLPDEIKIKKSLTSNLPLIKCDENQISTVISNLMENAIESMEGKGILNVRTALVEKIDADPAKIKRYVEIRIEDTGKGMSEEQIKNLFKPFYTTKKNGTGLGLVISQKIIEVHRGKIEISSKISVGTAITILLPADQYGRG